MLIETSFLDNLIKQPFILLMHIPKALTNPFSFLKMGESNTYFHENPIDNHLRRENDNVLIKIIEYDAQSMTEYQVYSNEEIQQLKCTHKNVWINIEGLKKENIRTVCEKYGISELIEEDIFSLGHSTKVDVFEEYLYALVYMLYYNENKFFIEQEQVSILLGKKFVITFQEEADKDSFNKIRARLRNPQSKVRSNGTDFLCYELLDAIVDDYFYLMDKLSSRIEVVEDEILNKPTKRSFAKIVFYRKELMVLRRNIYPMRDAITLLMRNENGFFHKKTLRYIKDISDHINQAKEMVENYRESISNIQDLYLNQENTKMNESMKVTAVVTSLLAPTTVISGIFGMNFKYIPFLDYPSAFYFAVGLMLLVPLYMIYVFRRRGWF